MSSSDAFWLNVWGSVAAIGFIIVIIGVVIEGVEHFKKFSKKDHARKLHIEKIGWFLVVGGLAMEFFGDHAAKRISDREAARLNQEAGDARKDAGEAIKQAAFANERASKFDAARAAFENEAELTRSNNLVLQAKLQPRIITPKNVEDFIFLTEKITKKIPITIHAASYGDDTMSFAFQIRDMLNKAKFLPDSANGGVKIDGIGNSEFTYRWRLIGDTNEWPEVFFHFGTTNGIVNFTDSRKELVNNSARPITPEENPLLIYQAIKTCMDQIKIKTEWSIINDPNAVAPGECEIYIPAKNN